MLDALSAETLKMTRHKATWFLVWLYPILFLALFLIAIAVGLAGVEEPSSAPTAAAWIADTTMIWHLPTQALGRFLIAAFVAVVFAGEYGWNTWKLIVPHRKRSSLIAAKFLMIFLLFLIAFALTAGISILFSWVEDVATGDPVPAGISAAALLHAHGQAALAGLAPFLFTLASISLAAVLTRSTIAALVIGIVIATAGQILVNLGPMIYVYMPGAVWVLFHGMPDYHLANLTSWITEGVARSAQFPDGRVVALGWQTSLAVAAAWTGALGALTFASFRRQDIN
jgi:ABC-2 type transport system permease protein